MAGDKDRKRKQREETQKAYQQRKQKSGGQDLEKAEEGFLPITEPCPIGWIKVKVVEDPDDPDGKVCWADPAKIRDKGKQRHKLTNDQMERIRAFKRILAEHEEMTEERAFFNFSQDMHTDSEIAIWERIAAAYEKEMALRPDANATERRLLYTVLLTASNVGIDSGKVVSAFLRAKALSHLERALSAMS